MCYDRMWVTKDGRWMHVGQMSHDHLLFAIAKIRRSRNGWRRDWLPRLELELVIRSLRDQE
jgi:hypothetical protein